MTDIRNEEKIWVNEAGQPTTDKRKAGGWTTKNEIGKGLDLGPKRPELEILPNLTLEQIENSTESTKPIGSQETNPIKTNLTKNN